MRINELYQNNKKNFIILICSIALIAVVVTGILLMSPAPANYKLMAEDDVQLPYPTLMTKNNQIYLVNGQKLVQLGAEDEICMTQDNREIISGMLSHNNTRLYYIKNYDITSAAGDLYIVNIENMTAPALKAKNVFCAAASNNGNALYLANVIDGAGDLYFVNREGSIALIDSSVAPELYGFSPDGNNFFYVKKSGDQYVWLLKCGNQPAQRVLQDKTKQHRYICAKVDNAGRLLFGIGSSEADYQIYLYENGQTHRIDMGKGLFQPYVDEDDVRYFLCGEMPQVFDVSGSPLYFVGEDRKAKKVSDNASGVVSGVYDTRLNAHLNFEWLYAEHDEITSDGSSGLQLYDLETGAYTGDVLDEYEPSLSENKIFIYSKEIGSQYICNVSVNEFCSFAGSSSSVLIYGDIQAPLSLVRKSGNGWSEPELLSDAAMWIISDDKYVWWIDQNFELWRSALQTGQKEILMDKAMNVILSGDTVYVCVDNQSICRLDNGKSVRLIDANTMFETANGCLVLTEDGRLVHFENGKDAGATVMEGALWSSANFYGIRYSLLTDDDATKLKELRDDAVYYQNMNGMLSGNWEVISSPHRSLEDDLALAQSYAYYGRLPNQLRYVTGYFADGFADLIDGTNSENADDGFHSDLSAGISMYDNYMYSDEE